jgi:sugar O-acyltransferase (sialic acid O-acetyltransferase NeuD family)
MSNTLVILGAASLAREFYFHTIESTTQYTNFIFVNDLNDGQHEIFINNTIYKVVKDWKFNKSYPFILAIGNPFIKEKLVDKALKAGLYPAETIIHPRALVQDKTTNKIGKGGLISPNCIITTNVILEDYVTLNLATTVGHDTNLGRFTTTNPGVHISGFVNIEDRVEIGTGASIKNNINICPNTLIGAQCTVVKDIEEPYGIYTGVPAKRIKEINK